MFSIESTFYLIIAIIFCPIQMFLYILPAYFVFKLVVFLVHFLLSFKDYTPIGMSRNYISYNERLEMEKKEAEEAAKVAEETAKKAAKEKELSDRYHEAVDDVIGDAAFAPYKTYFINNQRPRSRDTRPAEIKAANFYKALGRVSLKELVESQENMQKLANTDLMSEAAKEYFAKWAKEKVVREDKTGKYRASVYAPVDNLTGAAANGEKGEADVDYALKWWAKRNNAIVVKKDCVSKYSNACIRLQENENAEAQEFDHIVITRGGIVHIETKSYKGKIEVVDDNTWVITSNGQPETKKSPTSQVKRHQYVLEQVVESNYPVIPLICLANEQATCTGAENSSIKIVSVRSLDEALDKVNANEVLSEREMALVEKVINGAKKRA